MIAMSALTPAPVDAPVDFDALVDREISRPAR